jgi:hypothetical protein
MSATAPKLPSDLQRLADTLPPFLKTAEAMRIRAVSKQMLYQKRVPHGPIVTIKDGKSTLWNTMSILLDLASLPAAEIVPLTGNDGQQLRPKTFGHKGKHKRQPAAVAAE